MKAQKDKNPELINGSVLVVGNRRFQITIEPDEDGTSPYDDDLPEVQSTDRREAWKRGHWHYVFYVLHAIDPDGNQIDCEISTSCSAGRLPSDSDFWAEVMPMCNEISQDMASAGFMADGQRSKIIHALNALRKFADHLWNLSLMQVFLKEGGLNIGTPSGRNPYRLNTIAKSITKRPELKGLLVRWTRVRELHNGVLVEFNEHLARQQGLVVDGLQYPETDWKYERENNDTQLSYIDWVSHCLERDSIFPEHSHGAYESKMAEEALHSMRSFASELLLSSIAQELFNKPVPGLARKRMPVLLRHWMQALEIYRLAVAEHRGISTHE